MGARVALEISPHSVRFLYEQARLSAHHLTREDGGILFYLHSRCRSEQILRYSSTLPGHQPYGNKFAGLHLCLDEKTQIIHHYHHQSSINKSSIIIHHRRHHLKTKLSRKRCQESIRQWNHLLRSPRAYRDSPCRALCSGTARNRRRWRSLFCPCHIYVVPSRPRRGRSGWCCCRSTHSTLLRSASSRDTPCDFRTPLNWP